jgi:hypothetical protein
MSDLHPVSFSRGATNSNTAAWWVACIKAATANPGLDNRPESKELTKASSLDV